MADLVLTRIGLNIVSRHHYTLAAVGPHDHPGGPMQFPPPFRSSFGSVRVGDNIYIAGGHVGQFHNYSEPRFSSACHVLDLNTMKWLPIRDYGSNKGSNKPGAPAQVSQGLRLLEYGGRVYGFGGFSYEPSLDYQKDADPWQWYARSRTEIFRYSPDVDDWTVVGHLPRPRSSYVAGRVGDLGYLIGGWDGTPLEREDDNGPFGRLYSSMEVFDFKSESLLPTTLSIRLPMRRAFTATYNETRIVVAGGLGPATLNDPEGSKYDLVQSFDPSGEEPWSNLPRLPLNLFSPGICEVSGTLVVAGGSRYDRRPNEDILLLRPGAKSWTLNSTKPSRTGTFIELIPLSGREVLVLGGHSGRSADPNPMGLCEVLTID